MAAPARGHHVADTTVTTMNTTTNSSPPVRPSIFVKPSLEWPAVSSVRPASTLTPGLDAVVGLGSNLGDRLATLRGAIQPLREIASTLLTFSSLYETDAVGAPGPVTSAAGGAAPSVHLGGPYLNAAVRLEWNGSPQALLAALLSIEARFGRVRRERFGPRTLDLDVLFIKDLAVEEPGLVIPHPRLLERRFALEPLLEVAPDARHPATGALFSTWLSPLPVIGVRRVADGDWAGAAPIVF
jgi:2-amino-4-hydroxy-6-hydroxymethyldihydropteridine diphosphokinase